ncbi:T9SS type B sorting domain-containing protein [Neolewinella persica]|uniref:T9SS type B sorting domain-containing protein n=1 Tax=Neolewinella persica TaxID=70998 RepID=UPI000362914C|nr:T9SS type B sorting domain-containing protein [Neolewinella persica]
MYHKIITLVLCCGLSLSAWGQRCGFTDTVAIGAFGSTDIEVSIEDYLNNDLSNAGQGLCGVSVYFQHSYVYDFTLTVTSPAGQSVQLIGPVNAQTRPPTNLARWFIDFNTCGEPTAPDTGAPGQWNNNAPFNWSAFGLYRGEYAPASGCLEDFNTGPVNGNWTFTFNTTRTLQSGRLTYLLLEFCDDLNAQGPCCFADAGELEPVPEIEICEFTPAFPVGLPPRYRRPRPDAALYGYTYAIARNDSVLYVQDNPDLGNFPAGSYEICGLSYRLGELGQLPVDGTMTFDDLRQDFSAVSPLLCADLTPVCQLVRLFPIPDTTFVSAKICDGGVYRVGFTDYTTTGIHPTTLGGRAGCDSIVVLDLEVVTTLRETLDTTICAEAVYPQDGNLYNIPGTYVDTVLSVLGCDSIITLNLSVAAAITFDTTLAICAGDSFLIGTEPFFNTIQTTRVIPAANGCDSTVNLDLIVIDPIISLAPVGSGLSCDNPTILLDASASSFEFINRGVWVNTLGVELGVLRTLTVDTGGVYIYELTHDTRGVGCTVTDTLIVPDLRFEVEADLALTQVQCTGLDEQCNFISCRNPTLGILATPFPAGVYDFQWSVPPGGNIIGPSDGPEIVVDAPGIYPLTIENPATGCRLDTFYAIGIDTLTPSVAVTGNELLNCAVTSLNLQADTNQINRASLEYTWRGSCLPGPVSGPMLQLDCPGSVTLTVLNLASGCSNDTTFTVVQDIAPSNLSLAPAAPPISCYFPERTLDASGSSSSNGQEFYWTYESGSDTIGSADTLVATLAGIYTLTAVDRLSRCSASAMVTIPADTLKPVADSGIDTLRLNCYTPTHTLGTALTSQGPEFAYSWVMIGTPFDTIGRDRTLFVDDPGGFFRLAVTNVDNGCVTTDQTRVLLELDTPFIRIDLPFEFDCFVDSVSLDARSTNLNYDNVQNWSGPCVPNNTDTSQIWVYCPGTYYYTVINEETGCRSRDSVTVSLANNSVVALLPDTAFLNCETGQTRIDRSQGTDAPVVRWFRDGTPVNLLGQRPVVTVPGIYTLVLGNFNESCLDTARIVVAANCPALSVIVPPDSITCDNSLVLLDGTTSVPTAGPNVTTEWLIPTGAVVRTDPNERLLTVFTPGTFGFVINNLISGDADTTYVDVARNLIQPIADAGLPDTVNCYQRTVTLSGAGSSSGPVFDYLWTNTADDTLGINREVDVSSGGIYLLRVTQRETGCDAVDNVRVFNNLEVPDLAFSSPVLPCDTIDFALAVIPDAPGNYAFNWSGPAIVAQGDYDTVRIADVGVYAVTVTNIDNGCPISATVEATRLPCPPFPMLEDTTLTCRTDTITLLTTFRDPCQGCTYTWRRNGAVVPGENTTELRVTETGTYRIVVINVFGLRGTAEAVVTESRILPVGNAGPDRKLSCKVTDVLLWEDAPEPDFPFSYRWVGPNGGTLAGEEADSLRVSAGGLYQLETTNLFSDCRILDTVLVTYDTVAPIANAGNSRLLDCNNKRRVLDGIRSSLGMQYVYQWSGGPSTACLEGTATLNPLVRCGGDYQLLVRDTLNGCSSTATVRVETDEALPIVIPIPDTSVNCARDTLRLIGQDISRADITYGWEQVFPGGNVPLPEVQPGVVEVTNAGRFRFYIRNDQNGCDNDFTVNVSADLTLPLARASAPDTFFCALDSLLVIGSGTVNGLEEPTYSWRSATGFFIDHADATTATIFQPDTYFFEVTNPRNACVAIDSVVIFRDVEAPIVFAGADTTLTCSRRVLQLNGDGITVSGQSLFSWTTTDGNILSGAGTRTPLVDSTGRYQMNITDPVNDCSGADIVRVFEDTLAPRLVIRATRGFALSCNLPEAQLTSQVSQTQGSTIRYQWTGPPGAILQEPTNTDRLMVSSSGNYRLMATSEINGCATVETVRVTQDFTPPTVNIVPPLPLTCNRDSTALRLAGGAPPGTYRFMWLDDGNVLLGDAVSQTVFAEGSYTLITRDLQNGCRDTVMSVVTGDFVAPDVILRDPLVLNCSRSFTTIDGSASTQGPRFTREWRSPGNSAEPTADSYQVRGTEPGFYYLTVSDLDNGCSTTDSVELILEAVQIDGLEIEVDQPACVEDRDGSVEILNVTGGTGPFRYRLDNGLLTDRIYYDGLPLGSYLLEVIGEDGCGTETTFNILPASEPFVFLREDTIIRLGDSLSLDFFTNFVNWDTLIWTGGGSLPVLQSDSAITVRPLSSQSYRLTIMDEEGCFATDDVVVQVDGTVEVYVPNVFSPNGDGTNDLLRPFAGPQVQRFLQFRVFDRWGELLYDLNTDPLRGSEDFGWDGTLDGKTMNPQVFIWELEVELVDGAVLRKLGDAVLKR